MQYNPFDLKFKSPFGATECGTTVRFFIECENAEYARLLTDKLGSFPMKKTDGGFSVNITPTEAGLLFYAFEIKNHDGTFTYCSKNCDGILYSDHTENYFQLTVFEKKPALPDWYTKGIVYQIFPDRFNVVGEVIRAKENVCYREWHEKPEYIRTENNEIAKWDFYGGNFKGITEKLTYLKELGVTAIYLNPVFESSSNHRYSTADFKKVDNILGTLQDFQNLIAEAKKLGIYIILDGVFNHVGADSIYFNKFGNYGTGGAYNDGNSPYCSWFRFKNYPHEYECWWGVTDLPDLEEMNPDVQSYLISDEDSVLKYWTRMGIGGWRLDVADELPDEFLSLLFKHVKAVNPDAIIMGEVWEDASNKVAYDTLRKYFTHRELDCVMNYPFRDNLLEFFEGKITAGVLKDRFMTQMQNYPASAFFGNFNLLGTHDVERILTKAEEILPENPILLLTQLVALQFNFPGVPCIYYGDEAGLTGGKDPDNRKPYPWGNENQKIMKIYKKYTRERTESELLKSGHALFLADGDHLFGVKRYDGKTEKTLWVNRSDTEINGVPAHGIKEEF